MPHNTGDMDDSAQSLGHVLRLFRARKGLSRADLAGKVNAHHNTIQKLENGERKLTVEWISKLAPHLGTTVQDFLSGKATEKSSPPVNVPETVPPPANVYSPEKWPRDLPVMGIGECGPDGWSAWNGEVIAMAPRPPSLAGVPKAYAVYATGDSMEPRYYAGELLHINPARHVEPGNFVLVQVKPAREGEAPGALIKRLVRRSATKLTLEQFNPAKRIEIKTSDVVSIHRVVGTGD